MEIVFYERWMKFLKLQVSSEKLDVFDGRFIIYIIIVSVVIAILTTVDGNDYSAKRV